jgi:signal transduction histidine kinase
VRHAPHRLPRARAERTIAATRVAIASFSLYAVWLDPSQPARFAQLTYILHIGCIAYALVLAVVMWRRPSTGWLPIATHAIDIVVFSVFQFLTQGPSVSPFFNYFIFSLFCGAVRWGWRGTLATAPAVMIAFVSITAATSYTIGPSDFDLNRFIIRGGNLVVFSVLLVYLGLHEARLREEIRRLAGWPPTSGDDAETEITRITDYAAGIVAARRVVAIWEPDQEPRVRVAVWTREAFQLTRHASQDFEPWVNDSIGDVSFLYARTMDGPPSVTITPGRALSRGSDPPIHGRLAALLDSALVASAAFKTERLSGRVFFAGLDDATTVEILPLIEVVAREIGASIDQCEIHSRTRQLAIGEERIRVARDLHDGVLQSLTGVRLELQSLASQLRSESLAATRDRLVTMERALAAEQRELRFFIEDLQPIRTDARPDGTLASRLEELTRQIAAQWKTPVTLRLAGLAWPLPGDIEQALPPMIHEAVVNALKHGEPSRVAVMLQGNGDNLRVIVTDDGHGFPFEGRFDHDMLVRQNVGPASLRDRVRSLGGDVSVDSSPSGSKVEIRLPVVPAHA